MPDTHKKDLLKTVKKAISITREMATIKVPDAASLAYVTPEVYTFIKKMEGMHNTSISIMDRMTRITDLIMEERKS